MTLKITLFLISVLYLLSYFQGVKGNGIQFSRTVRAIAPDTDFVLKFNSGCSSSDSYGSNNCNFNWGDEVSGSYYGHLGHDLEAGSTLAVNMKVDKVISFNINCAVSGDVY